MLRSKEDSYIIFARHFDPTDFSDSAGISDTGKAEAKELGENLRKSIPKKQRGQIVILASQIQRSLDSAKLICKELDIGENSIRVSEVLNPSQFDSQYIANYIKKYATAERIVIIVGHYEYAPMVFFYLTNEYKETGMRTGIAWAAKIAA